MTRFWIAFIAAALGIMIGVDAQSATLCESITPHSTISAKMARDVCEEVRGFAKVHGVDEGLALSVSEAESNFRPWVISHAGAVGPMQIKPHYHCPVFLGVRVCKSRAQFSEAGVRHLAELLERRTVRDALRCYNAGIRGCREDDTGAGYARRVSMIQQRLRRR